MSIADKLSYLLETKALIKAAIEAKGVEVPDDATFRDYAELIASIKTGGGSNQIVTYIGDRLLMTDIADTIDVEVQ